MVTALKVHSVLLFVSLTFILNIYNKTKFHKDTFVDSNLYRQ